MDQIADLLIRIKNAASINRAEVLAVYSKVNVAILTILKSEGFISDFEIIEDENKRSIQLHFGGKALVHIRRISKPGRRIYVKSKEIPRPLRGLGTIIISTSNGVTTGREAYKKGLGGELLCEIW